jgi:hypothetical protein
MWAPAGQKVDGWIDRFFAASRGSPFQGLVSWFIAGLGALPQADLSLPLRGVRITDAPIFWLVNVW